MIGQALATTYGALPIPTAYQELLEDERTSSSAILSLIEALKNDNPRAKTAEPNDDDASLDDDDQAQSIRCTIKHHGLFLRQHFTRQHFPRQKLSNGTLLKFNFIASTTRLEVFHQKCNSITLHSGVS